MVVDSNPSVLAADFLRLKDVETMAEMKMKMKMKNSTLASQRTESHAILA